MNRQNYILSGRMWRVCIGLLLSLVFFIIALRTISDYGLNLDEPTHFLRGQGYLHFILTGETSYTTLDQPRRSAWQVKGYGAERYLAEDIGHPPGNGILAAFTNYLFYQKWGIIGDLEGYKLFEISVASALVFLVFFMSSGAYGMVGGFFGALSLMLYPMFLGESHFNIKDPILATFYAYTLYFFYTGIVNGRARYIIASSLFAGLSLGTKFNTVFIPFIVVSWLAVYWFIQMRQRKQIAMDIKKNKIFLLALAAYPIVVGLILFAAWPYLWADPGGHLVQTVQYYSEIGSSGQGWSLYAPQFIGVITPEITLFLAAVGLLYIPRRVQKEKGMFSLLVLLWLLVPIVRVMRPGAAIDSGVRQIMEYVPALCIIAGLGASETHRYITKYAEHSGRIGKLKASSAAFALLCVPYVFLGLHLANLHPNENVYINALIGGLSGAKEKGLEGAGQTMGNIYLQGIRWANDNLPEGSRVALALGGHGIIPNQYVSDRISFGPYSSARNRLGEYVMERMDQGNLMKTYDFLIYDRFLTPFHVISVDGIPLLKIWKNDPEHIRPEFRDEKSMGPIPVEKRTNEHTGKKYLHINLPERLRVVDIAMNTREGPECVPTATGIIYVSPDGGGYFIYPAGEDLMRFHTEKKHAPLLPDDRAFHYFFPATKMKAIDIYIDDPASCLYIADQATIYYVGQEEKK